MLSSVIAGLVSVKRRSLFGLPTRNLDEPWDQLELRILVLLSLTFQIILLALGSRRKITHRYSIRFVVWCVYLSVDAIATYALGVIQQNSSTDEKDRTPEMRVFWTSYLLIHLGGTDTITAYALEDNELWLRQFLGLLSLIVATLYSMLPSWSDSYIYWLYVVVLISGLIKYGELVWALWAGSSERFQDSTPEPQQMTPTTRMEEEQNLEEAEQGHDAVTHQQVTELQLQLHKVLGYDVDVDVGVNWQAKAEETELLHRNLYERSLREILIARELIDVYRPAFSDQPLNLDERDFGRSKLKDEHYLSVFNIIAIELGFIYDLLFTKAMVFQTKWGLASRVISLSLTTVTIGVFTFFYTKETSEYGYKYDTTDVVITFVLMVAAVYLDLYAILFHHLFSDKFTCWLDKHKKSSILSIINRFWPLYKRQRWSNKIGQFNLLSYSLKEKHFLCRREILDIQKYFYLSHVDVSNILKERLYDHIRSIPADMYADLPSLWAEKWKDIDTHRNRELESLKWSIKFEFDTCVLIWHIATQICFDDFHNSSRTQDNNAEAREDAQVSLDLSRYMLHLLVMYPSLLPAGRGRINFENMHSMMTTLLGQDLSASARPEGEEAVVENEQYYQLEEENETRVAVNPTYVENDWHQNNLNLIFPEDACRQLLNLARIQLNFALPSKDKSKIAMFYGCQLAAKLKEIKEDRFRFWLLRETWIGMLTLGALKCDACNHLQQLRRGGELLTHVWLLLIHFGFTCHPQIPDTIELAKLNINLTVENDWIR